MYQFYVGNFSTAILPVHYHLYEHGLWARVRRPLPSYVSISPERKDELERDDIWAVNIIFQYISHDILGRCTFPRPVMAH